MYINFVVLGDDYKNFPNDPDNNWNFFTRTNMIWSYLTYLRLKEYGYPNIGFSNKIVIGAMNVGTATILGGAKFEKHQNQKETIYVVIRADKLYASTSNVCVVQSPEHSFKYKNSYYINHWPQPGLVPRKSNEHMVKKIGMAGIPKHYAVAQYQKRFEKDMSDRAIEIVQLDRSRWNDYSDIDIVLAVREFNKKVITHKPASKLINGWKARVPVICNPESTYRWVGENGKDFIEIESYDQLLSAIDKLREDKNLYHELIKNGEKKVINYSNEKVCMEWIELFEGIRKKSINVKKISSNKWQKVNFKREDLIHIMLKLFNIKQ